MKEFLFTCSEEPGLESLSLLMSGTDRDIESNLNTNVEPFIPAPYIIAHSASLKALALLARQGQRTIDFWDSILGDANSWSPQFTGGPCFVNALQLEDLAVANYRVSGT